MLALKLKLNPTKEQIVILDKMFWKWASICSRINANLANKERLTPPKNASGIWFSKTQLVQAKTNVKDLISALKKSVELKKRDLIRQEESAKDISEAIEKTEKRDINQTRPSNFRIKKWVEKTGNLNQKYHTLKSWQNRLKQIEKTIKKRKQTIELINKGRIQFKPKRITLHTNSFLISFGKKSLLLKPFHKQSCKNSDIQSNIQPNLEIQLITEPIQPEIGSQGGKSSSRSKEFLMNGIINFLIFALDRLFFGMSDSEKMLLKAKSSEKLLKKEEKLAKKKELFNSKLSNLKKIMGREITSTEKKILEQENKTFFTNVSTYSASDDYKNLLKQLALELFSRKEYFNPQKYLIILRKPMKKLKTKKISNLKPENWEYFLQLSYQPFEPQKIDVKSVMGIDRGIKHLLAVAIFDPNTKKFILNKLIENPVIKWKFRLKKLKNAIKQLKRRTRVISGEHIKENQLKLKIKSIENKVENLYHNISSYIVKMAKEKQSIIVFESLERRGIKQHARSKGKRMKALNYFLSNFDYGKIATMIKYKADKEGVHVFDILPAYTSQNCAKCLIESGNLVDSEENYHRDKENSKIGYCKKHGYIDADLNAARTIAVCYHKKLNEPMPFGSRK